MRTPRAVRETTFSQRLRGYDEAEVYAFQEETAAQIEFHQEEVAVLRAEVARLREQVENEDVKERAVALFSQAQTVADRLIEEAVQHAKDLMMAARAQQREILGESRKAAAPAAMSVRSSGDSDVGYVQTYAQVAAVQLRSVLDALSEQVDKLSEVSRVTSLPMGPLDDPLTSVNPPDRDSEPLIWATMVPQQAGRQPGW
jgi:cell division initiation protein